MISAFKYGQPRRVAPPISPLTSPARMLDFLWKMKNKISLKEIEQAILNAEPEEQKRLLGDLPHLLKIPAPDLALLKIAEPSFDFWNNTDDLIYDQL